MFNYLNIRWIFALVMAVASTIHPATLRSQVTTNASNPWKPLEKGLSFIEVDAPEKSILNDSRIFILRSDPFLCDYQVLCASRYGKQNRTAEEWCNEFKCNVVVNAGMFNMINKSVSKGYLKNFSHYNNKNINSNYNVMMGLNPVNSSDASMIICDLTCRSLDSMQTAYQTLIQGMRMIDGNGNPMLWNKNPDQACSMVIAATDSKGSLYFIFVRSPYTHQKMISFLYRFIPEVRTAVYLEGGPEASLYIMTKDTVIAKIGSYVSKTYPTDSNQRFWKLPNVIGITSR